MHPRRQRCGKVFQSRRYYHKNGEEGRGVGRSVLGNGPAQSLPSKLLQNLKNWIGIEKFKAALDGH